MRYEACLLPIGAYLLLGAVRCVRLPALAASAVLIPMLLWSVTMTSSAVRFGAPPPVTWQDTQGVLRNTLPYYRASRALLGKANRDTRVYLWFCDDARFYFPGRLHGDWFGGYTYTWLGAVNQPGALRHPGPMLAKLKAHGFEYVVVDRERAALGGSIYGAEFLRSGIVNPAVPVGGVEVLYDDRRYAVFRLL
jgi:hypothetical protein